MKKNILLSVMFVLASLFVSQHAMAQKIDAVSGQVVWTGKTIGDAVQATANKKYIYLIQYQPTLSENNKEKYISAGGAYGVQGVLSSVGMRMQITRSGSYYQIITRVQNSGSATTQGDRMGFDNTTDGQGGLAYIYNGQPVYLDRGSTNADKNQVNWGFVPQTQTRSVRYVGETTEQNVDVQTYAIRCTGNTSYYIGVNDGKLQISRTPTYWIIVSEEDYKAAMDQVTWGEVDLGAFIQDAEFGRDNKDGYYWVWENSDTDQDGNTLDGWSLTPSSMHWHQRNQDKMCNGILLSNGLTAAEIGVPGVGDLDADGFRNKCGSYYAAEIYNEVNTLSQRLSMSAMPNLSDGLYKMTAQALYYDDVDGFTNDEVAYFFVKTTTNGEVNEQELPIIPMNKEDYTITPHSGVSAGYVFDTYPTAYLLEFYVEIKGETTIEMGIRSKKNVGWTVIGNIHMYAHGKQALFIDEDWEDREIKIPYKINGEQTWTPNPVHPYIFSQFNAKYSFPATVYYNRTMTTNGWNTICLPISLTGSQVRQSFGNDCIVSEFVGISHNQKSLLVFKPIDLDQEGMIVGKPYIIKPTREPDVKIGQYEVEVGNGGENHTVTLDAPIYFIMGVTKDSYYAVESTQSGIKMPELIKVTDENPPAGEPSITFEGSYYRTGITQADVQSGTNEYWMITKGNMYHLKGSAPGTLGVLFNNVPGYNIWGTYCYLHAPKVEGQAKTYGIGLLNDDGDITAIEVEGLEVPGSKIIDNNSVYTLNGQKIGGQGNLNSLSKGIYIVNGKKYVVK